jgi:hypothetical protein
MAGESLSAIRTSQQQRIWPIRQYTGTTVAVVRATEEGNMIEPVSMVFLR